MRKRKIALFIFSLILGFISCNNDDDNVIPEVEIRNRAEQQIIDNDSIVGYLENHYYNSSDFVNNSNPSIANLVITELLEGETLPTGSTMLDVAVGDSKKITFADTTYEYYVLNLNPNAAGNSPTFADEVRVRYEGFTLDDNVFDSAVTPVDLDLVSLVPGWRKVMPKFNTAPANGFIIESDGTVDYMNHGVGLMFLPSGLGYFSSSSRGIKAYSPLAFKFDLLQMKENDHDNDGIPSYLEDLNGDGELIGKDQNTDNDFDNDGFPRYNYIDNDDDGDGVLTKNEILIKKYNKPTEAEIENLVLASNEVLIGIKKENDGTFTGTTSIDTDKDGTADYLDAN